MTKFNFLCFFTNKYFFYLKAKLTVSKSLCSMWRYFFNSTHLKGCHFFSSIFQPKGKSQDLVEPCFPYTFYPSFMPPIRSEGYSSFILNHFLAHCALLSYRVSFCINFLKKISLKLQKCALNITFRPEAVQQSFASVVLSNLFWALLY